MKNWRFLIQQEGDREWLPLESLESEILEGRYRLVGQSQRQRYPVQIHLVYRDLEGAAPRHHRRESQTNDQGLVGIFPFTRLQPGLWQVVCQIDTGSVALHLQVVPQEGVSDLEPELDLSSFPQLRTEVSQAGPLLKSPLTATSLTAAPSAESLSAEPLPAESPSLENEGQPVEDNVAEVAREIDGAMASVADLFQTVEDMADQVINAMAARLSDGGSLGSTPNPAPASSSASSPASSPTAQAPDRQAPHPQGTGPQTPNPQPVLPATIELQSSAYTLHQGQPLTLQGTISGEGAAQLPATLSLTIIEPHAGEAIAKQTYPEAIAQIPQSFSWAVSASIPAKAQLVLARLSLRSTATPQPWPLAECSFAIMVLSEEADNPFLLLPADPANQDGGRQLEPQKTARRSSPVELPPFLKGKATVPPETRAAALAKVAEMKGVAVHQEPPSDLDEAAETANPFRYPSGVEDSDDATGS
ncbi:MAG: hypothetical protein ACFB4J_00250 [Elainellaceae cyanobacterium]